MAHNGNRRALTAKRFPCSAREIPCFCGKFPVRDEEGIRDKFLEFVDEFSWHRTLVRGEIKIFPVNFPGSREIAATFRAAQPSKSSPCGSVVRATPNFLDDNAVVLFAFALADARFQYSGVDLKKR